MYKYHRIRLSKTEFIDEHRLVMEQHLWRKLLPNEVVHHINRNTLDNHLENLEVQSLSEHTRYHIKTGEIHQLSWQDCINGMKASHLAQRTPSKGKLHLCLRCKKYKQQRWFNIKSARWNGLQPFCRKCQ